MIDAHEHTQLAGPGAAEATRRLDQFGTQARFAGTVLTDHRRLIRLIHRADPAVYPDTFATCIFQPDASTAPAAALARNGSVPSATVRGQRSG